MEECVDGQPMVLGGGNTADTVDFEMTLLEPRPFRPFKSSEEYLYAMKEDLAEWLNALYEGLKLDAANFLDKMETGVILCQHANNVVRKAREYYRNGNVILPDMFPVLDRDVVYRHDVLPETFHARDNVSNFIAFCRRLSIKECLLFETDDLVLRKNERSFILCLLEVARRGCQFGMPAPLLVQMEQEIDAEIANDDDGYDTMHSRQPQVVTNDLRNLHERVVELLSRCTCPSQFPMIRVADGKYRIGDTKVLIFVRILRSHVMVRVGGGWDTLEHYLDKHDPCRCRSGHRLATSAKLTMMQGKSSIPSMHVTYNRPTQAPSSHPSSPQNQRRSLSYMSPTTSRRSYQSSPPSSLRTLPPLPCSDDSSTSSLHEHSVEHSQRAPPIRACTAGGATSSEEELSDDEARYNRSPRRRSGQRELLLRDTAPSSWRYSPGAPRSPPQPPRQAGSRLPALAPRQKAKVVKVAPLPHSSQPWNEQRSQSSEDVFLGPASGPTHAPIFHSRGPSPVGIKVSRGPMDSPGGGFRRNDPKRHSSPRIYQRSGDIKMRLSPPKFVINKTNGQSEIHKNGGRATSCSPDRHYISSGPIQVPESQRPDGNRRRSCEDFRRKLDKISPLLEKLQHHQDLCTNKNFLMKVEQLIAEFRAQDDIHFYSLPPDLGKERNPESKRSPENGKSPSKIPLPTWYSKCHA